MTRLSPTQLLPTRRHRIMAGSAIVLCGVSVGAYYFLKPSDDPLVPSYDIVLPQQRSVDDLGGWQRVSPAEKEPVFAYSDEIKDTQISVSQQPIPESFDGNVAASVKQLAESYSATSVVEAGGTQAYIGRSARGPQSVIFAKDNVLVLIKSQNTVSQSDWIRYINNLVNPKEQQLPTF